MTSECFQVTLCVIDGALIAVGMALWPFDLFLM